MSIEKFTKISCHICGKDHNIRLKEYNRQTKKGRKHFFCSISCAASYSAKFITSEDRKERAKKAVITSRNNGTLIRNKRGKFTWYLNKIRQRSNGDTNITEKILNDIWIKQSNKCALSEITIFLKDRNVQNTPFTASVDRIDSTKPYTPDNIQFVAYSINLAKNTFSDDQIKELIEEIRR